jgi:YggT family protein
MTIYNEMERNVERNQELNVAEKQRAIAAANQNSAVARFVRIIYFLFGILEMLLAVRIVLHLLAANAGNAFADLIYGLTNPFTALFSTLVANPTIGAGVLEITTIIAMVAYAILAWIIGRVIWLTLSRPR